MRYPPIILPQEQFKANRLIWLATIVFMAFDLLWAGIAGLTIDITPRIPFFWPIMGLCVAVIFACRYIHRDDPAQLFGHGVNQIICISFATCVATYLAARFNLPLTDDRIISIDHILGFDWKHYIEWLDKQPLLAAQTLTFAYESPYLQALLLMPALYIAKHSGHGERIIAIFCVTGFITSILAGLFPAMGGYVHYAIDPKDFQHLHPAAARIHEETVLALRNHKMTTIPYPDLGIVTFPSFHATMAVMFAYASLPFRFFRLVIVPLNILMLISCIGDGGHYLVDVIAGVIIAFIGIWVAEKILPRRFS